jgi:hypothetical protein
MESFTVDELLGIIWRGRELSPNAKIAYMLGLKAVRDGEPFPSVPVLAGLLGVTERRVEQMLAELVALGELVKVDRGLWALSEAKFASADRV